MKEIIKGIEFTPNVIVSIVITIFFANYVASLLFSGKNSLDTYNDLLTKKVQLEEEIKRLQSENASLQKDYFELKNLEPEQ
ncbi:MAG: septum formation initiator [Epsilonproteobacteria bacterium]|nr:septum formation initiator [Campylobacterota bacterium]